MNVSMEKLSDVTGKLIVTVAEEDYAAKVKQELKKLGQRANIPGFRAGHVPADQIRRRFGKEVKSDVLNNVVYDAVIAYIRENNIAILGEPLPVAVEEVDLDKKDFVFEYEIGMSPALDIELDQNVTLPFYEIEVSDAMVDEQDKNLCERFGAQVPGEEVDAKALVKGSLQQLNADGTVNENEGAVAVENGIVAPFLFKDKKEADKFIGKKLNDKVVFNPYASCEGNPAEMASMLNLDKEIAADVKNDFIMSISEIIVVKPAEHNQELYDNVFGKDKVHDENEYREALKQQIAASLAHNSNAFFDRTVQDYLLEKYGENMELPVEFLKKWLVARNEELTAENIDEEFASMLPSLKWQLIRDLIASKLDVTINQEDLLNYAKSIAYGQFAQYGMTNVDDETVTDFAKRMLNDKNNRARLTEEASDAKLFFAIRNAVKMDKKTVTLDEFKKLISGKAE